MPKPGDAITEAVLLEFYVADGAVVAEGELLYRLETEKVELDISAPVGGTVTHVAEAGLEYPVGALLATID